jgi:chemotaxis protein histidine kinase CheA
MRTVMLEPELARVFLEEARTHLSALSDEVQPRDTRARAATALRDAAGRLGLDEVTATAGAAAQALARDGGLPPPVVARLIALLADLEPERTALPPIIDQAEAELVHGLFHAEAREHLEGLSAMLRALEKDGPRFGRFDELLRKTHTLKGGAATVGLDAVAEAAHELEEIFLRLRSGTEALEGVRFEAVMALLDSMRVVVEGADRPDAVAAASEALRRRLAGLRPAGPPRRRRTATSPLGSPFPLVPPRRPASEPGIAAAPAVPAVAGSTDPGAGPGPGAEASDFEPTARLHRPAGSAPVAIAAPEAAAEGSPAPAAEDATADERRVPDRRREDQQVRVDATRLDQLMDAAGELVFDRTRIERRVQEMRGTMRDLNRTRAAMRGLIAAAPDELRAQVAGLEAELAGEVARLARSTSTLLEDADALRRTTVRVYEGLTRARMTSVRLLFQRLVRPLRDFERLAGKRVEAITSGEDTELDKAVVEKITDPLIQLVRNAVAHGIETEAERVARGKPPTGKISLAARQQGASVVLEVADDGAGIDVAGIRRALVAAGRLDAEVAATASDERVIAGIFEPGVSSRPDADELAGRGFGLDVVRESIVRLGGEIAVASTPGEGTCFRIRLPLATAITQAFLFKVAGQVYAVPHAHVTETVTVEVAAGAPPPETVPASGAAVPLVSLHQLLHGAAPGDVRRLVAVVLEFAGRRLAAACDRVIGPREVVVKSLGPLLAPLSLYAGATISGSGKVQLILDTAALVRVAYPEAATPAPGTVLEPMGGQTGSGSQSAPQVVLGPGPNAATGAPALTRALVCGDARGLRETVSRMLAAQGLVVDAAGDAAEAWDMLHQVPYDLLVTDIEVPHLAAPELIARVRAHQRFRELRVLALASHPSGRPAGADDLLVKPITRHALVGCLAELLGAERGP